MIRRAGWVALGVILGGSAVLGWVCVVLGRAERTGVIIVRDEDSRP